MTSAPDDDRDSTIEDIHRVRQEIWEEFGGDLSAVIEHLRRRQGESGADVITLEESLRRKSDASGAGR